MIHVHVLPGEKDTTKFEFTHDHADAYNIGLLEGILEDIRTAQKFGNIVFTYSAGIKLRLMYNILSEYHSVFRTAYERQQNRRVSRQDTEDSGPECSTDK